MISNAIENATANPNEYRSCNDVIGAKCHQVRFRDNDVTLKNAVNLSVLIVVRENFTFQNHRKISHVFTPRDATGKTERHTDFVYALI